MWQRVWAVIVARNREYYRDRTALGWNLFMPLLMILGFAFIFHGGPQPVFTVAVIGLESAPAEGRARQLPLLELEHIRFVPIGASPSELAAAVLKVERHEVDLLIDAPVVAGQALRYWVNEESPRGVLVEHLLTRATPDGHARLERQAVSGAALRYVDWVLPGILGMTVMFASLWGVGWVIVRYRKNGVLRRLSATPLRPWEFLLAQVLSRLVVVLATALIVFFGIQWLMEIPMRGSLAALALVFASGALCLISLGLVVASRLKTEEVADGLLNLISWPMLLLSGVWFSLDGASSAAQGVAQWLPLTHLVAAARRIMLDGAGLFEVLPEIGILTATALVFLALAAWRFRWE